MTVIDHTVEREAWPSFTVGTSAIEVAPLTATIGAELSNISLAEASRDDELFAELRSLLLQYKVLFFRDQDITRAEHVALAEQFGPLEDHPVDGSDPDHPGPGPHLQGPRQQARALRERLPLRRHLARGAALRLGAPLRRGSRRRRRHHLGQHGRGLPPAPRAT